MWCSHPARAWDDVCDVELVARLARTLDLCLTVAAAYRAEPMTPGSKGQTRVNPAADELDRLDRRALAIEKELGLTPRARAYLRLPQREQSATAVRSVSGRRPTRAGRPDLRLTGEPPRPSEVGEAP